MESGKHHGPIYSLYRNWGQYKYFMTVGDWTAKIWSEELQQPIMMTRYHSSYLTDGCWSNTRCGLFYLTRMDGFLDVWDFFYRQNEVAYSQKVSDSPLTAISVLGDKTAIGDAEGTVSMMSLCRPLWDPTLQPREKDFMGVIFDREFRREKALYQAKKLAVSKGGPKKEEKVNVEKKAQQQKKFLEELEQTFFTHVDTDGSMAKAGISAGAVAGAPAAGTDDPSEDKAVSPTKEEPKPAEEEKKEVPSPTPAKKPTTLAVGDYKFKMTFSKSGAEQTQEVTFKIEEGGTISAPPSEMVKYSIAGLIDSTSGKLTMKIQYEGEGAIEAEFDGTLENENQLKGTYKSNKPDEFDESGTFTMDRQ